MVRFVNFPDATNDHSKMIHNSAIYHFLYLQTLLNILTVETAMETFDNVVIFHEPDISLLFHHLDLFLMYTFGKYFFRSEEEDMKILVDFENTIY